MVIREVIHCLSPYRVRVRMARHVPEDFHVWYLGPPMFRALIRLSDVFPRGVPALRGVFGRRVLAFGALATERDQTRCLQ
jgi:hypothetical protein